MTDPAMIERGDLKNKVRFAAMSKNEDMKKTEKRSGGQVCQVAVVDVCFNVTVLEGALLATFSLLLDCPNDDTNSRA